MDNDRDDPSEWSHLGTINYRSWKTCPFKSPSTPNTIWLIVNESNDLTWTVQMHVLSQSVATATDLFVPLKTSFSTYGSEMSFLFPFKKVFFFYKSFLKTRLNQVYVLENTALLHCCNNADVQGFKLQVFAVVPPWGRTAHKVSRRQKRETEEKRVEKEERLNLIYSGDSSRMSRLTHLVGPHWADDTANLCVVLGLQVDGLALVVPVSIKQNPKQHLFDIHGEEWEMGVSAGRRTVHHM